MTIGDDFYQILMNYIHAKENKDMDDIRAIFRRLVKKTSDLQVIKRNNNLIVKYGAGIGNIANVPWLAFLDNRVTTSTQHGIYCVYLLKADMSGFYLTFNQGVGKTATSSPTKEKFVELHNTAMALRKHFSWLSSQEFTLDDVNLNDRGKTGQAYDVATVAYKYYELHKIPPDKTLENDLSILLDAYEQYIQAFVLSKGLKPKTLPIISEQTFSREIDIEKEKAALLTEEELEARIAESNGETSIQETVGHRYVRNQNVAELTKRRAKGKCKLCRKDAPFNDLDGNPFLEVHHITWLSEGGKDTLNNTVALCPNCHRRVHLLKLQEDIAILRR